MEKIFLTVLNMSLTASFVIAAILLARLPLKKAPKIISYVLWTVAGFRLVFPFTLESAFSLLPFKSTPIPQDIAMQAVPRIDSGITAIDNAVSAALPAAAPYASVNPLQIWFFLGSYLWLLGVMLLLIYSFLSVVLLKHRLRDSSLIEDNLYEADNLKAPFVIGLRRPKIYIPTGLTDEEYHYIILHEQTHIRRHDHAVKMFAYLVLCLHWFNPLVWAAFILMGTDMEMSCDERVLKEMGTQSKKDYSYLLVSMASKNRIIGGSPLAFGEGSMKGRIKNVLNFKKPSRVIVAVAVMLVTVLSVGLAVSRISSNTADLSDIITDNNLDIETPSNNQVLSQTDEGHSVLPPAGSNSALETGSNPNAAVNQITVTREGMDEILPAYLAVSDMGYAMWIFEDFVLTSTADGDIISPAENSPLLQSITMHIARTGTASPRNIISNDLQTESHRIINGGNSFDVTFSYPLEAAEGGGVLLHTMLNTFVWLADTNQGDDPHNAAGFLNSDEGASFQPIAYGAAKTLLSADANELAKYMLDPSEAVSAARGMTDIFSSLEYMFLIWSSDCVKSDTEIHISYSYAAKGEDSTSYVTMELVNVDDVWKVRWIGIEK